MSDITKMEVRILCPFCDGVAELGFKAAVHSLPACRVFKELSVEDYVHEVHEIFQMTKRPGDQRS